MKVEITTRNTLISFYIDEGYSSELTDIKVKWLTSEKLCTYCTETKKINKLLVHAITRARNVEKINISVFGKEPCLVIEY